MESKLIVYGHHHCADALRMEAFLDQNGIAYEWRDVADGDPKFRDELRLLANGYLSVPTLVLPSGAVLVEPNPNEVLGRLRPADE
jgi:mycoredoxin